MPHESYVDCMTIIKKEICNCPQVVEKIDAKDNYQSLFKDTIEKSVAKKVTKISELRSTRHE